MEPSQTLKAASDWLALNSELCWSTSRAELQHVVEHMPSSILSVWSSAAGGHDLTAEDLDVFIGLLEVHRLFVGPPTI